MKKILILLFISFSFFDSKACNSVYLTEQCIVNDPVYGWSLKLSFINLTNPNFTCNVSSNEIAVWVKKVGEPNSSYIGALQSVTFSPNEVLIPLSTYYTNSYFQNGGCLYFQWGWACAPPYTSNTTTINDVLSWDPRGMINIYNDRYTEQACPCELIPNLPKDNCIAQFEFLSNTQELNNPNYPVKFDDNDYPNEYTFIQNLTSGWACTSFGLPPSTILWTDKYRITDSWDFGDGNTFSVNSVTNPFYYDKPLLSQNQFTHTYSSPNTYTVCHRKKIEIGCYENQPPPLIISSDNPFVGVAYDCNVCLQICINDPYIYNEENGLTIYQTHPVDPGGWSKPSNVINVKTSAFNNISVFPNPITNNISITLESLKNNEGVIYINDLAGKVIFEKPILLVNGTNNYNFNIHDISNGNYILTIKSKDDFYKEKITIMK